jgi:hypothetical protein
VGAVIDKIKNKNKNINKIKNSKLFFFENLSMLAKLFKLIIPKKIKM